MLVRVRDDFNGTFGHYVEKYHSVEPKHAGDAPFEVSDRVAREQIANGVLEAVVAEEKADPEDMTEAGEVVGTEKEMDTEETADAEKAENAPVHEMSWNELKFEAKERGINSFGKSREELIRLIEEYDESEDGDAPEFEAEDPV